MTVHAHRMKSFVGALLFTAATLPSCGRLSATNGSYTAEITLVANTDPSTAPSPCPDNTLCATPTAISGALASIVAWVGTGETRYPLVLQGWKPPFDADGGSTAVPFDLASPIPASTEILCCGDEAGDYPSDEKAFVTTIEIFPLYIDFDIDTGGPLSSQRVRQVFADLLDLGYRRGDRLVSHTSGYTWCDAQGCDKSTRPTGDSIGAQDIRAFNFTVQKNKAIVPLRFKPASSVQLKEADLRRDGWKFRLEIPTSGTLYFPPANPPASITTDRDLLGYFQFWTAPTYSAYDHPISLVFTAP